MQAGAEDALPAFSLARHAGSLVGAAGPLSRHPTRRSDQLDVTVASGCCTVRLLDEEGVTTEPRNDRSIETAFDSQTPVPVILVACPRTAGGAETVWIDMLINGQEQPVLMLATGAP